MKFQVFLKQSRNENSKVNIDTNILLEKNDSTYFKVKYNLTVGR